ncbi:MAG: DMT family transporter [Rhodospirillaceae bacterium]
MSTASNSFWGGLSDPQKGVLIVGTGMLVLSTDSLLIRLVDLEPWALTFWRSLLTLLAGLLLIGLLRRSPWATAVRDLRFRRSWHDDVIAALYGVGGLFFVMGIHFGAVADSLFIIATAPLWAAMFSALFLKEHPSATTWMAIFAALGGIGLVTFESFGSGTLLGAFFALLCALILATVFTFSRSLNHPTTLAPAYGGIFGCITALAVHLLLTPDSTLVPATGIEWLYLLINGALVVPFALCCVATGPAYLPAPQVSLFLLLETALGPVWVWWALGEEPGFFSLVGGSIVVGVLALHSWAAMRRPARQ